MNAVFSFICCLGLFCCPVPHTGLDLAVRMHPNRPNLQCSFDSIQRQPSSTSAKCHEPGVVGRRADVEAATDDVLARDAGIGRQEDRLRDVVTASDGQADFEFEQPINYSCTCVRKQWDMRT